MELTEENKQSPEDKRFEEMMDKVEAVLEDFEASLAERVALLELMKFQYLQIACPVHADEMIH